MTFLAHSPQILDIYTSFARQAAQAMTIKTSKTLFPVQTHPAQWRAADPERVKDTLTGEELTQPDPKQAYTHTRWTVNRSPFVYGRHQDQFEIRTYQRALELYDADSETIQRWLHYVSVNLPFGVGVDYTIHDYEPLPSSFQKLATGQDAEDVEKAAE